MRIHLALCLAISLLMSVPPIATAQTSEGAPIPYIDVHAHFLGGAREMAGVVRAALERMDQGSISKLIVLPPPETGTKKVHDYEVFIEAIRSHSARIAFLGGGGSLNIMLQQAGNQTDVSDSLRREFTERANAIIRQGARGFGEMAIRHLSLDGPNHPYENVPADNPLLLLLADIAASLDVPIDIHCDIITEDIPTPDYLKSPNNPKVLQANAAGFERLLDHNPKAKICWAHAGSDNTGHWTVDLSRRLLQKHPNLYMSLRLGPAHSRQNFPLTKDGQIKPEWLSLLKDFPTRFVIGTDQFIGASPDQGPGSKREKTKTPKSRENVQVFLKTLPDDLARKIASENAIELYKLKVTTQVPSRSGRVPE